MKDHEYDFFLSFSGKDIALADRIYDILTASAPGHVPYKVFYQREIELGKNVMNALERGLKTSEKIIAVITPNYLLDSDYTEMEFHAAWTSHKLLIFRFRDAEIPVRAWGLNHQEFDENDPQFDNRVRQAASLRPTRLDRATKQIPDLTANMPGWKGKTSHDLIGRDNELRELTAAFKDQNCSIVCVIADGGYGKSSLVTRWLEEIRDQPSAGAYLGIEAGYGYSFYQQGWENRSVSTNDFFLSCLSSLKGIDKDALRSTVQMRDWSDNLLSLLKDRPTLLVLDGLEPNQIPSEGVIEDPTFRGFVKQLSGRQNEALCIITSRIMPPELTPAVSDGKVRVISLGPLSDSASADALVKAGVSRDNPDLNYWVRESKGHPLLLALLAPAIKNGYYKPNEFESHRVLTENGKQDVPETIRKMVWANLAWLGHKAQAVLLCACMFEKPPGYSEIRNCLLEQAAIDVVTLPLLDQSRPQRLAKRLGLISMLNKLGFLRPVLSEKKFVEGAEKLEKAAMLARLSGKNPSLWTLEVHPVIQVGVRSELSQNRKPLWQQANWTIYQSLLRSAKPLQPDDPKELAKIYAAIPHGVNAGKGLRAGWTYAIRCLRGYEAYSTNNHGMIADDVSILSHYFVGHWQILKTDIGLNDYAKVQAYGWSGALLTGVNRWKEGKVLIERGLELAKGRRFWSAAARAATHLAVLYAIAGELTLAESRARNAIDFLQKSQPLTVRFIESFLVTQAFQRMSASATLGSILHYQGKFEDADKAFNDAVVAQQSATKYRTLRAMWCFRQVEFMLDQGKYDEADWLIEQAMIDPTKPKGLGDGVFCLPLLRLAFIRTQIRRFDMRGEFRNRMKVSSCAKDVAGFGEVQTLKMDWLVPIFKIALSGVARLEDRMDEARLRIEEANKWAQGSGNKLFEVDVMTEQARVHLAVDERKEALQRLRQAEELSVQIGYRCRLAEITHIKNSCV